MSNFTIGVFDSGMGGLTAVEELGRLLPQADIVYFGDTGHVPYGGRPRDQLLYMARKNIAFLRAKGAQLILAACGTITAVALDTVAAETDIPLFGVAAPAVEQARQITRNRIVGFIATEACVASGFNQALLENAIPGVQVIAQACPPFVPLIEAGIVSDEDPRLRQAIDDSLRGIRASGADTVILGCTHYPIISAAIQAYLGPQVHLISSSASAACALAAHLPAANAVSGSGLHQYYTSGDAALFSATAEKLLGHPLPGPVEAIEPYPLA